MRRVKPSIALLFALVFFCMTSLAAFAASPHWIRASASGPDQFGDLTVNFKLAGLGDNETVTITASANATAKYACQNNAGNFPSASNKRTVSGPVSDSGDFTSGQNGQITDSLTLNPPAPAPFCPPGQNEVLTSVTYTNVSVTTPEAGTKMISGTFRSGCLFPDDPQVC